VAGQVLSAKPKSTNAPRILVETEELAQTVSISLLVVVLLVTRALSVKPTSTNALRLPVRIQVSVWTE
jgi:hypothetical protein